MLKLILLIVFVAFVWWLLPRPRKGARPEQGHNTQASDKRPARPGPSGPIAPTPDVIVECAHCGLHLPRAEAIADSTRGSEPSEPPLYFCSQAHRDAARQTGA